MKSLVYLTLRTFKRLWKLTGLPMPPAIRRFRHGFLARYVPVIQKSWNVSTKVAVVIPCHNYGKYLRKAIESALTQSHPVAEIIVVDDASTDDTSAIASSYASRGVRLIRGEWHNVGLARNAGLHATTAPFLVFLDADDMLHEDYVARGLEAFDTHPEAAIACSDAQTFGRFMQYRGTPGTMGMDEFDVWNPIHAGSMVRREALLQVHGWSKNPGEHNDWVTWREILYLGWKVVRSEGLYYYRMHHGSMSDNMVGKDSYAKHSGLLSARMTLCIPLSGRTWMWPLTKAFLEIQTYPPELVHLILLDSSQNPEFGKEVRTWLNNSAYKHATYHTLIAGEKGVADRTRSDVAAEIGTACSIIYNTLARMVTTPLTFIIEDDVIPPSDAFVRLTQLFNRDVVSVSGLYWHRTVRQPVCWEWDAYGKPVFAEPNTGVQEVGGTGFGCLVIRSSALRNHVFQSGVPHGNYDENFFAMVTQNTDLKALVDWNCVCRHYQSPDVWF